jgi:hypothetical protein
MPNPIYEDLRQALPAAFGKGASSVPVNGALPAVSLTLLFAFRILLNVTSSLLGIVVVSSAVSLIFSIRDRAACRILDSKRPSEKWQGSLSLAVRLGQPTSPNNAQGPQKACAKAFSMKPLAFSRRRNGQNF